MIREMVKIDEDKCDGCGLCVPNCHEGALQIIDGKARLISDLMCDGLGACLGHCPQDAISIEKREAAPYDEVAVIIDMIPKGINVVVAHLIHLKEHNETEYFQLAMEHLIKNKENLGFDINEMKKEVHNSTSQAASLACGCPGSAERVIKKEESTSCCSTTEVPSALRHWPVQMHLINPNAQHFQGSDLVLAADCVAFSMGNFHPQLLEGKTLAILCPKLDTRTESYVEKITALIDDAKVNTITVVIMEVPCCGGLIQFVQQALQNAGRKVPVKAMVVGVNGEILQEEWL